MKQYVAWALLCLSIRLPCVAAAEIRPTGATLCDIEKWSTDFGGRMVRIRATALINFEVSILRDTSCGSDASIWFSFGDDQPRETSTAAYAFLDSFAELKNPERLDWRPVAAIPLVQVKQNADFKRLGWYLRQQYKPKDGGLCIRCPLYSITGTFTGRLDYRQGRLKA